MRSWNLDFQFDYNSNARFVHCVDPFHEVKSKREKKKEVHTFFFLIYYLLLVSSFHLFRI